MSLISILSVSVLLALTTYFSADISPLYTSLVRIFLIACIIALLGKIILHHPRR